MSLVTLADVRRLLDLLRNRIGNMLSRAGVQLVDDSKKMQIVQIGVLEGETREGCERFQQYGFTSVPLAGAEAVVLFPGGNRDHGLVVAVDDRRYRKTGLAAGEVALYHKDGASILLKADGSVEVTAKAGADIILNGGSAKVSRVGDATTGHTHAFSLVAPSGGGAVTGTITSATDTIAEGADAVKA